MKNTNEESTGHRPIDRGFLFILAACVIVIALAAYLLFISPTFADTESLSKYEYESEESVSASDSVPNIPAMDAEQEPEEDTDEESAEEDEDALAEQETETAEDESDDVEQTVSEAESVPAFTSPTEASQISRIYCVDSLSYDETMEDWRTHAATDFSGEKGDSVMAVADGTVLEIGNNALYGPYVVIQHSDSLSSRYAGIAEIEVEEGDHVTAGQDIAQMGDPMPAEAKQGVHLHLEMIEEDKPVDLNNYLEISSTDDDNS